MAQASPTAKRSPNGRAGLRSGPVAERVTSLRELGRTDPQGARDQAWDWIEELAGRAREDREGTLVELQELFVCGQPAEGIHGQAEGRVVTWSIHPVIDKAIGALTDAWMPWLGKRFDAEHRRGTNTLAASARWPMRLLWPLYSTQALPEGCSAFEFTTYVEAGMLDPSIDVLVIDYESVSSNPRLVIRQVRDELVQIVLGANLGKMLVNVPGRSDPLLGLYFALKSEIS